MVAITPAARDCISLFEDVSFRIRDCFHFGMTILSLIGVGLERPGDLLRLVRRGVHRRLQARPRHARGGCQQNPLNDERARASGSSSTLPHTVPSIDVALPGVSGCVGPPPFVCVKKLSSHADIKDAIDVILVRKCVAVIYG